MASLGSALINKVLGHSEAENVFRPWWDKFEDLLVYGLVMLGLMVVPTSMVMGTPLECTLCKDDLCNPYNYTGTGEDPDYNKIWVKKLCTFNGSVDSILLYFPYILLLIALAMVLIEKIFLALFKANQKLDKFYKLLNDQNIVGEGKGQGGVKSQTREAVEVEESFLCSEDNYFLSYLIRTCSELLIALFFLAWIMLSAVPVILSDSDIIPCNINGYLYVCSGHPQEFYKFILTIAIVFIFLYIIMNIFNLHWIIQLDQSNFNKIMKTYRDQLEKSNQVKQGKRLDEIYFNNRDLRLLLNLLAGNLGIGAALSAVSLFDKDFHHNISVVISKIRKSSDKKSVKINLQKPSPRFLFSLKQFAGVRVKLVVELSPRKESIALVAEALDDENKLEVNFEGLKEDEQYSVNVAVLVNGKVISTTTKHELDDDSETSDIEDEYEIEDKKNL